MAEKEAMTKERVNKILSSPFLAGIGRPWWKNGYAITAFSFLFSALLLMFLIALQFISPWWWIGVGMLSILAFVSAALGAEKSR